MRQFAPSLKVGWNEQSAGARMGMDCVLNRGSSLPHTYDQEVSMIGSTLTAQALDVLWLLTSGGIACMLVRGDKGIW